ncbi:DEAD/DEAH box helicase [Mycoplasmoides pneumoniae]|uniref:DEAD/DEAH box helicase n=1 Tax=Mycoplasmoides pneumoniae TaxID=2104 RepID=UPI0002B84B77|nr:DEAD/DEAH box helicase [Mycoplasmoides pneumoniae]AGC04495.1 DEAD/DEAH box helicase [Mycoplasmoides pneumoniae M129-B7]ARI11953.1 DEAD/DEAH box helicase [Mycoplasmoides pneumoniae]ARI12663.1 DEAD/DEAH box helicase [Mycoplasmoides pneumoniae]ARI13363.1 DEAD/DEAH box helicase [Mycoplasmoides pneumoniae]ARI14068.1 DEAD/DEAH box helicase [Mycoplasmoides pneumoniae]
MDSTFNELGVSPALIATLKDNNINQPTTIQQLAIPQFLQHQNLIVHSPTGTGKTAVFAIPVIETLLKKPSKGTTQTLVVAPTRELAEQIKTTFINFAKHTHLKVVSLIGGIPIWQQLKQLENQPEIVVGTMGRVMDLLERGVIKFEHLEHLIIDEVDLMLDRGFKRKLFDLLSRIEKFEQIAVYSASYNEETIETAKQITKNGIFLAAPELKQNAPEPDNKLIDQFVCYLFSNRKKQALYSLVSQTRAKSIIVFCDTKKLVDELCIFLRKNDVKTYPLHGDKAQFIRERNLKLFANTTAPIVLVTTDLIGRGIHVEGVDMVVNYSACVNFETYLHRMGRTGRNNHKGSCITFCTSHEKQAFLKLLEQVNDKRISPLRPMRLRLIPLKCKTQPKKGKLSLQSVQKIYVNPRSNGTFKRVPLAGDLFKSRMRQPERDMQKNKLHDSDWQSNM